MNLSSMAVQSTNLLESLHLVKKTYHSINHYYATYSHLVKLEAAKDKETNN